MQLINLFVIVVQNLFMTNLEAKHPHRYKIEHGVNKMFCFVNSATSTANTYECIHTLTGVAAADTASYSCSAIIGSHTESSSTSAALSVLSEFFRKISKIIFQTDLL